MSPRGIVVALHEEDVSTTSETPSGTTRFEVEKIIMHQNYNRRNIDNDIAVSGKILNETYQTFLWNFFQMA